MSGTVASAEVLFREDLGGGAFAAGEDRGYWKVESIAFPVAVISVAAALRPGAPDAYALRLDLTGYPGPPTAQFWDTASDAPLDRSLWPGGGLRVSTAFNPDWRTDALYIPFDRLAREGHDKWPTQYPQHVWDPAGDITQYLELVRDLLNSAGYTGVRGA